MEPTVFTVADYLLTRLKQLNVTDVFQIPGDYCKHFTQTLERFVGVNAVGAMNELDAGYAADAYGRTRGLAAMSLQYGVSTFSALNAVAGAYVERIGHLRDCSFGARIMGKSRPCWRAQSMAI